MESNNASTVLESVSSKITKVLAHHNAPGASVGIVDESGLSEFKSFGFADLVTHANIEPETVFRVGSITKTFTGSAIFKLQDEGELSIDDPLTKYLPEFATASSKHADINMVTLRRLLCHHSGLVGELPGGYWNTLKFPDLKWFLNNLDKAEVVLQPDQAFKYSNLAFTLLGELVTRVTNTDVTKYIEQEFLSPLGMKASTFCLNQESEAKCATGYHVVKNQPAPLVAEHPMLHGHTAAGQLYSTTRDLAKWIAFQVKAYDDSHPDTSVLSKIIRKQMHRPMFMNEDWTEGYGMPWWSTRMAGQAWVGHSGLVHGFTSTTWFCPAKHVGVIILANSDGHPANHEISTILADVIVSASAKKSVPEKAGLHQIPTNFKEYTGSYEGIMGSEAVIEFKAGQLWFIENPFAWQTLPPAKLLETPDAEAFQFTAGRAAGELLKFRRASDGSITGFDAAGFPYKKTGEDPLETA